MYTEGILKDVECYNHDSVKAAIEEYVDMGLLETKKLTTGEDKETRMIWGEKELKGFIAKLNGFRLVPASDIEDVIKTAERLINTEFMMVTKM